MNVCVSRGFHVYTVSDNHESMVELVLLIPIMGEQITK